MRKMNNILKPFGPSIGKFKVSKEIIKKLIKITDGMSTDISYALVGRIDEQLEYSSDSFKDYFSSKIKEYTKNVYEYQVEVMNKNTKPNVDIKLGGMWVNNQYENEYNPVHLHPDGSHLTSVLYLKVPNIPAENFPDGHLHIINNSQNLHNSGSMELTDYFVYPKVGDFYIFPSYLKHTAYPFKGKGVRRSLVINSKIEVSI